MIQPRGAVFPPYVYARVVQAKLFMENNYFREIRLQNIARQACFSKFHFVRLFKQIYGVTPHQFLMRKRISSAQELLREGRLSITEVCFEVGFHSLPSFVSLFKRVTGQTPKAFSRACHRKRAAMISKPLQFVPHCFAGTANPD